MVRGAGGAAAEATVAVPPMISVETRAPKAPMRAIRGGIVMRIA
ncbi:hypothetical protein TPA0910_65240 [Streptomyces hygroscopicus subsp. sporocinereus]|uniref:Uncharacterized protein n=1 Tax=Streptomyces hygroscopicus TaxID=1912 RepID=A0ABQ3UA47_STRHY|nr:hypothetical protein TPA0910_65240 [Streptomyces hygroscopicus]